jgi:alkylhydroperoxidase family enzyme
LAHHPRALRKYLTFAQHVMSSSLTARDRELLILRTAWLRQVPYEWAHHVVIGKAAGLSPTEIAAIKAGADGAEWSDKERALLLAVGELDADSFISEPVWTELLRFYDHAELIDIVLTVGSYAMLGMALRTFGVELDQRLAEAFGGADPSSYPVG